MVSEGPGVFSRQIAGRLAAVLCAGCGGILLGTLALPPAPGESRAAMSFVSLSAIVVGVVAWVLPWQRWPRKASLWLLPPGLALIATTQVPAGLGPQVYGMLFVVAFVGLGLSHRSGTSLLFAPLAFAAYVAPLLMNGGLKDGVGSAVAVISVCGLVGESVSWLTGRLGDSERRYRELVEFCPDAVVVHDGTRFLYANPAAAALLRASSPEDLVGQPIMRIVAEQDRELVRRRAHDTVQGQMEALVEEHLVRLDGQPIWAEVAAMPLEFKAKPAGLVVLRDITERKIAEAERRISMDLLRRTNHERQLLLSRLVRAQEEERQRLAHDVHDDPIQKLVMVAMRLASLERSHPDLASDEEFQLTVKASTVAVEHLRHLTFELYPRALDRDGLAASIREYVGQEEKLVGSPVFVIHDGLDLEPPGELRVVLYRITQEALVNVRKHAQANNVVIDLERAGSAYRVRVADDGVGFDTSAGPAEQSPSTHLGLVSMRERAEMAGGGLRVVSAPRSGTSVEFWVPADLPASAVSGTLAGA